MKDITIVGAGLIGSLLAIYLAKRGYKVEVFERNPDPRDVTPKRGRSVNITLCDRGLKALDGAGVGHVVRDISVPGYGRLIHQEDRQLTGISALWQQSRGSVFSFAQSTQSSLIRLCSKEFTDQFSL